jgi:peptidylamidoglycolate lyase
MMRFVILSFLLSTVSTLAQTQRLSAQPYTVVHGWPVLPDGYALGQVSGVGIDSHDHVWIFHRADHSWATDEVQRRSKISVPTVLCFDGASGKLLASWGVGMFISPHGLRVDVADNIWVTDLGLHQVFKFDHSGKLLLTIGEAGVAGLDGKHLNGPADVAIAADGSIYVADGYGNSRIAHFSNEGQFLGDWGQRGDVPGEFNNPHNVVLDPQGRVYVADRQNSRIQIFTADGKFLEQWKREELGRPWGLAFDRQGNLFVVDGGDFKPAPPDRGRILKLTSGGKVLAKWSTFGNYDGQLYWGHDIAVGPDGAVYVGDVSHGMRIQKFVPQPSSSRSVK